MKMIPQNIDRYNVCLITIDSCRFDSAEIARTPTLNSISRLMPAESHATYTYPSHQSLFIGILPVLINIGDNYINGYDQIWRSNGAKAANKNVFQTFSEQTIITHYESKGYDVRGYGGVTFFDPNLYCNSLCKLFKNFTYFGPSGLENKYQTMPRNPHNMPLGNIDRIIKSINDSTPFFLFINSPETHIPYDTEKIIVDKKYTALIERLRHEHSTKKRHDLNSKPFTIEEIQILHTAQIKALEYIDNKLGELFIRLPNTYPTLAIILSDHGEEFGEEGRFGHAHSSLYVTKVPVWSGWITK